MATRLLIISQIIILFNNDVFANDCLIDTTANHRNIIKIELLTGGIEYERALNSRQSFQFGLHYNLNKIIISDEYSAQAILSYRYSVLKNQGNHPWPGVVFIGPYINYSNYKLTPEPTFSGNLSINNISLLGVGLLSGANMIVLKRIVINPYIGFGYNLLRKVVIEQGNALVDQQDLNFRGIGAITIGYRF